MYYNYIYSSNKKSQNSNFIKKLIIYDTLHAIRLRTHCLTHHNDRQERFWRLNTEIIIDSVSSRHSHQLLRSSKTRHEQRLVGVLFHDVGVRMTKGVDHFGDCFKWVRPINRLFSCKYRTFGQMPGLSTYFPFSLAFYFAIILTTRRSLCTL